MTIAAKLVDWCRVRPQEIRLAITLFKSRSYHALPIKKYHLILDKLLLSVLKLDKNKVSVCVNPHSRHKQHVLMKVFLVM